MAMHPVRHEETKRDRYCHLSRNLLLNIEVERRVIRDAVVRMSDAIAKFEDELIASKDQEPESE